MFVVIHAAVEASKQPRQDGASSQRLEVGSSGQHNLLVQIYWQNGLYTGYKSLA
jgi:hypothetical protein